MTREERPPDDEYYKTRHELLSQGDIFRDLPLAYPTPATEIVEEEPQVAGRRFLSGPFEVGMAMLILQDLLEASPPIRGGAVRARPDALEAGPARGSPRASTCSVVRRAYASYRPVRRAQVSIWGYDMRPIRMTVALGSLAAMTGSLLSGVLPAAAAFPGGNGKIVFATDRDTNDEIYVMAANGLNLKNLSKNTAFDYNPQWSPDGRQIVFESNRAENNEIYVMDPDGSNVERLTKNAAYDMMPGFSPDGTDVVFVSERDAGDVEIYVLSVTDPAHPVTRLTNAAGADWMPAWSPDGSKIAFASVRDGDFDIYVMKADGTGVTQLTNDPEEDVEPSWSPDGSKIAFTTKRDGNYEVYVMNADGSDPTDVSNHAFGDDRAPAWSPNGMKIAFQSNRDGDIEIYSMNADGAGQIRLTVDAASDCCPNWQPTCTQTGTPFDDTIEGTEGNDVLCGLGGNDTLKGMGGNDVLFGGKGNDQKLVGGNGADIIVGGPGNDRLYGGAGDDRLNSKDGVRKNDGLAGGTGTNTCPADPGDDKVECG